MHRVHFSYRGGDAMQSQDGAGREGGQAESEALQALPPGRDRVDISTAAHDHRPRMVVLPLDEATCPLGPEDETLRGLLEACFCALMDQQVPVLTPGELLASRPPAGMADPDFQAPLVALGVQRCRSHRPAEGRVAAIPVEVAPLGEDDRPTVVEVVLAPGFLAAHAVSAADVSWDPSDEIRLLAPPGGWDHDSVRIRLFFDVDGWEDQVVALIQISADPEALEERPVEPPGRHDSDPWPLVRRLRVWVSLDEADDVLVAHGVPGFGIVYTGAGLLFGDAPRMDDRE
jgi:hypothetical protein